MPLLEATHSSDHWDPLQTSLRFPELWVQQATSSAPGSLPCLEPHSLSLSNRSHLHGRPRGLDLFGFNKKVILVILWAPWVPRGLLGPREETVKAWGRAHPVTRGCLRPSSRGSVAASRAFVAGSWQGQHSNSGVKTRPLLWAASCFVLLLSHLHLQQEPSSI